MNLRRFNLMSSRAENTPTGPVHSVGIYVEEYASNLSLYMVLDTGVLLRFVLRSSGHANDSDWPKVNGVWGVHVTDIRRPGSDGTPLVYVRMLIYAGVVVVSEPFSPEAHSVHFKNGQSIVFKARG